MLGLEGSAGRRTTALLVLQMLRLLGQRDEEAPLHPGTLPLQSQLNARISKCEHIAKSHSNASTKASMCLSKNRWHWALQKLTK